MCGCTENGNSLPSPIRDNTLRNPADDIGDRLSVRKTYRASGCSRIRRRNDLTRDLHQWPSRQFDCRHKRPPKSRGLLPFCHIVADRFFWTSAMPTWIPMFALPNIDVQEAIDADGMTLASLRDERVRALAKKHRRFAMYMRRFKTEFGQAVAPSIVLYDHESSQNYRSVEAIAGFRDAIAMSVIPYSWAHCLRYENNFNIRYHCCPVKN
jgi:hypothetical protein